VAGKTAYNTRFHCRIFPESNENLLTIKEK